MKQLTDQIGQKLSFEKTPTRIVSLVPSQTELLVDLGLIESIVGITKFCVHPSNLRKEKTIVGGTKKVHYDRIEQLNPDIILCNKEENTKEMVDKLKNIAPVHVSDIATIEDNNTLIKQYGLLFNKETIAQDCILQINQNLKEFISIKKDQKPLKCLYLIWKNPYMAAGRGTFINHLLEINGFENTITKERYPEVEVDYFKSVDAIFLSSEPFPFNKKHLREIEVLTNVKVLLVDGEYFSWYGSRLIKAFTYFKSLRDQLRQL